MNKFSLSYFGLMLFIFACKTNADRLQIATKGTSKYRIVYSDNASEDLVKAIDAFKVGLNHTIGSSSAILTFSDVVGDQREEILIGDSKRIGKYKSSIPFDRLGKQGYFSGLRGNKWLIQANTTDALKSGLHDILNNLGGVKLSGPMTQYSSQPNLTIDSKDYIHIPDFNFRMAVSPHAQNEDYRYWNFLNIDGQNDWGTWGYSTERIFPSESYFKSHPEYFAKVNSKPFSQQINFSNPEVITALEKNLEVWTMTKGRAAYWSVSPYANHVVSNDPITLAATTETGSAAGALIKMVNTVAAKNSNRTYTVWLDGPYRTPVTNIKPATNVMLVLDTKDVDHAKSLGEGKENEAFRSDLAGWKKVTNNIAVVSHLTNEINYMMPFPNLHPLAASMKYLKAEGVEKVIFTGVSNKGVPFADLKFYVAAQLAWNLKQNVDSLIWKYVDNTFGGGAKSIYGYIQALEQAVQNSNTKLSIDDSPAQAFKTWLNPNNVNQLYSYFNSLNTLTQGNSDLKEKVDLERLSLIYSQLEVAKSMGTKTYGYFMNLGALKATLVRQDNPIGKTGEEAFNLKASQWNTIQGMRDLIDRFVAESESYGIKTIDIHETSPQAYRETLRKYLAQTVSTHSGFNKGVVMLNSLPDLKYGASDPTLLNDGVLGLIETPESNWLGLIGGDAELTWDLGVDTIVNTVTTRFLQNSNAKAFTPSQLSLLISTDGRNFTELATKKLLTTADQSVQTVTFPINKRKIRALKLKMQSIDKCPGDHVLAGSKTAILLDEIILK